MQEASVREHGTTREQPLARLAIEKLLLTTLLDMPPVLAAWSTVTLHRDAYIEHHKALYSLPSSPVGKTLWAKATETVVQPFNQHELRHPSPAAQTRCALNRLRSSAAGGTSVARIRSAMVSGAGQRNRSVLPRSDSGALQRRGARQPSRRAGHRPASRHGW